MRGFQFLSFDPILSSSLSQSPHPLNVVFVSNGSDRREWLQVTPVSQASLPDKLENSWIMAGARKNKGKHQSTKSDSSSDTEGDDHQKKYDHLELSHRGNIRLLKLLPHKKKGDMITCGLSEHNTDKTENIPQFEAVSWSWGNDEWNSKITIRKDDEDFYFKVPQTLINCLVALRDRHDAKMVPMMSMIYGHAKCVNVWIGDSDSDSKLAIQFMQNEILRLQHFDELLDDPQSATKWLALGNLLTRPWFSRRWVIQEIVLAKKAVVYCGRDSIDWDDFADAVQLFVKVESATRKVSEVLKKDPMFYRVPNWFDYVSALGASRLVEATTRITNHKTRQPVPSLEYLVSTLTTFECSDPSDTIYALVSIAKDTHPIAIEDVNGRSSLLANVDKLLAAWAEPHVVTKAYTVDYSLDYVDICKDFIEFSIWQSSKFDPPAALDVICRPWAPAPGRNRMTYPGATLAGPQPMFPSWIPQLEDAPFAMFVHADNNLKMGRKNANPLVGLPYPSRRPYSAAAVRPVALDVLKFKKRSTYFSMFVSGFVLDKVDEVYVASQAGNIPEEWFKAAGWTNTKDNPPEEFWRTLVADRSDEGLEPPLFFLRACKEAAGRGLASGTLNTAELINQGRSSIISDFLRRVQSVIWNRSLMKTKTNKLGIVRKDVKPDDLICILYGCSVPVIFRRHVKDDGDLRQERMQDEKDLEKEAAKKIWKWWLFKEKGKREIEWLGPTTTVKQKSKITSKAEDWKYHYKFIGECYVHGMMDGDAITYQNMHHKGKGNTKESIVFELR
ncbi:hypothetical protein DV736_g5535, partial [Chaetothyriales sp. CBS 134916]